MLLFQILVGLHCHMNIMLPMTVCVYCLLLHCILHTIVGDINCIVHVHSTISSTFFRWKMFACSRLMTSEVGKLSGSFFNAFVRVFWRGCFHESSVIFEFILSDVLPSVL